ncbi:MAG: hypothetical protein P1U40_08530 [Coxiellaceae bacterium]|nr:hypothetical protein [Coxiellaceae bacterium]
MKILRPIVAGSLLAGVVSAMAGQVSVTNPSSHSIPFKYQVAYHNPGQPVVIKRTSEALAAANSQINIPIKRDKHFRYAGLVVLAVKQSPKDYKWHTLPVSARQFDGQRGCWVRTDKLHPTGKLALSYYPQGQQHGRITCRYS